MYLSKEMRSLWVLALVLSLACSKDAPETAAEGDAVEGDSIDLSGDGVSRARTLEPFASCEGVTAGDAPELTGTETTIEGTVRLAHRRRHRG